MIVESTQILCTVAQQKGQTFEEAPYRMSHGKHPCVIWCAKSLGNWKWLREFTLALNEEYKYRYNRAVDHKSAAIAKLLKEPHMEDQGVTERPQCMPDQYKVQDDAAQAYRNYYIGEKQYFAKWTNRAVPKWFIDGCTEYNKLHPETPTTPAQKKEIDLNLKKRFVTQDSCYQ
jgi:hypothetical protein